MTSPALRFLLPPVILWLVALIVVRVLVAPAEHSPDVTPDELRETAQSAANWIIANQQPDGSYTYQYHSGQDASLGDYNIVRHAGVTMSLYQVAGRLGDEESFVAADLGTEWLIGNLVHHDDWAAPQEGGEIKVGTAALMTIALAERRLLTGDDRYDDVMRDLGRFMVALQRPNGGFHIKWFVEREEVDLVGTSAYYPGEALWALAMLHEAFPGEGWDEAAWKTADFVSLIRDNEEEVPYPPLNDHWAAYGFAEMSEWGLKEHHIEYARDLAGRFSLFVRFEAQKTNEGLNLLVRGDDRSSSALGTWVEGLAALWRLSATDDRMADLQDAIRERAADGSGLLVERQTPATTQPGEAGAWFIDEVTRMDDQQHAISGLLYTADALEDRTQREPDPVGGAGGD